MGTIRKIVGDQHTDPLNSAAVVNRPLEDVLSISGYTTDGLNFGGFTAPDAKGLQRFLNGPFYDATHPTYGAKGDGSQDDRAGLFAANAAVGQSGVMQLWPGAGYHVDSDLTIDCATLRMIPGAKLQPNTGVTITVSVEHLDAPTTAFDRSRGGNIIFTKLRKFSPRNFGAVGDYITDDVGALNWMTNCIPDRSVVLWDRRLRCAIGSMWLAALGRADISYQCEGFPAEAYLGENCPALKWIGTAGGIMVGNYNSGYISFIGIFFDMQSAAIAIDQDQFTIGSTASSPTITTNAGGGGAAGSGPAILNLIPNGTRIRLSAAGPSGGQLDTTLLDHGTDGTHATLAVNASTTVSGANGVSFGQSAPSPNQRISTQCVYFRNKILGGTGVTGMVGIRVSYTSRSNCEFNFFFENFITGNAQFTQTYAIPQNGNGTARANFNGNTLFSFSAPGGSITSGTNAFGGFSVDTFSPGMNGARIRLSDAGVALAGPNLAHGALDGYMHYVDARHVTLFSDAALTTPLNATQTVSLAAQGYEPHFYIGQSLGIGIWIGPSFNAHKQIVKRNQLNYLNVGFRSDAGSFECENNFMTDNECDHLVNNQQAITSSIKGDVSENSRQWLVTESLKGLQVFSARLSMGYCTPSDGFIKVLQNAGGQLEVKNCLFENRPSPDNAAWNLSAAAGQPVWDLQNTYSDAQSLTELGWNSLPNNCVIFEKGSVCSNAPSLLPPEQIYANSTTGVQNGHPFRYSRGIEFWASQYIPSAGDFQDTSSWAWASDGNRPIAYHKNGAGSVQKFAPTISGKVALTDAATVAVDITAGDYLFAILTASRTIGNFGNWVQGQLVTFHIYNGSGGAMTTTWQSLYHLAGGAWTDPANGKARLITFRILDGVAYEISRSSADVG